MNTPDSSNAPPLPISASGRFLIERVGWHREVAVIRFDPPSGAINFLDAKTLKELDRCIIELEANPYLEGLVFASVSGPIFLAGAEIRSLERAWDDEAQLEEFLNLGQSVFNRIASLKLPTAAAIHGACLGGGYELALACDFRVATPDGVTRIGLPETRLGLIPAWGGTTRLPRLVGITPAVRYLTQGRVFSGRQALKAGLIDQLAPVERLLEAAVRHIEGGEKSHHEGRKQLRRFWERVASATMGKRVLNHVERTTKGNYPASVKAAEVAIQSANDTIESSLARERAAVKALAKDERCRNLFRLFCAQEQARKLARNAAQRVAPVTSVAVVGAGAMGAGIAQWISAKGIHVILRDLDERQLGLGMGRVFKLYSTAVKRRRMTAHEARSGIDRISPTLSPRPLKMVDWIIEAATEQAPIKQQLFENFGRLAGTKTAIASNTSALPIREMAAATPIPERIVGLHFFNPVHRMPLIEVVHLPGSAVVERALALVHQIGKVPILVRDSPGFLVNRVLVPSMFEAIEAFDMGMSQDEIDHALKNFGMPMGPLELADEVGLDVALHVAETLHQAWPERIQVPPLLKKMVEGGLLGKKAGRGFRDFPGADLKGKWTVNHYRRRSGVRFTPALLQERMILRMIDEAARCLDDGVVATAEEVDLGMVLGVGFPPFRGGPLRFADTMGSATVVARMEEQGMVPCELLRIMADGNQRFYER